MSDSPPSGLKEPENLTGKVAIDKNEKEFRGNYSCVYLGRYRDELVAVKIIQTTGPPESMKRKVQRETMVWATTDHPNILPFYGFADDDAFAPFGALISPWCIKGDASRYLSEHGETISFNDRINLWKRVINGVAYLHGHEPVIIHGDLKPGNILIDDSGMPRICDFGLARIFLEEGHTDLTTTSEHTGTARYLAPELVSSEESVLPTTASDVYALACIGLEFIYGRKPYANRANNSRGQIYVDIRRGLPPVSQPPSGEWPSCNVWPLITEMWNINPLHRPLTFTIGYTLDRIPFTLPHTVVQRIVYFSATILGPRGGEANKREWVERCDLLRSLCLVSRACRDRALPFLYGKIRLELREGYASMLCLVETLAHTGVRVNALDPLFTAHGRLVKTVILLIGSDESSPSSTVSSPDLRPLFQMMPEMRCMVISHPQHSHYPISDHPMATLEIRGQSSSLPGEKTILQALSFVQRLSIISAGGASLNDSRISSDKLFPSLQAISIKDTLETGGDLASTLDGMSRWTMPRLTSLHIKCLYSPVPIESNIYSPVPIESNILAFLGAHGHTIQDLTFLQHMTEDVLLSGVLSQCPSLRSLVINIPKFALPNDFPRQLYLERIVIWAGAREYENPDAFAPYFLQIEAFRALSLAMFPKLDIAEFTWGTWTAWVWRKNKISASFKVGTDAIVINGKPLHRTLFWPLPSALYAR